MSNNEKAKIDEILGQLTKKPVAPSASNSKSIDSDVDAILHSLGISATKPNRKVLSPEKLQQAPRNTYTTAQESNVVNYHSEPEKRAKIVNSAPLTMPVVQKDTETLELPTIKSYSEMQAKRIAEIERAAAENALARAADKKKVPYNGQHSKPRNEVLSVDIDDRFRAFFSKTVANDGSGNAPIQTSELEPIREEEPVAPSHNAPSHQKKKPTKRKYERTKQEPVQQTAPIITAPSPDEFSTSILRENISSIKNNNHVNSSNQNDSINNTLGLPMLEGTAEFGTEDMFDSGAFSQRGANYQNSPQKAPQQASQYAQRQAPEPVAPIENPQSHESASSQPYVDTTEFTESIVKVKSSDTFLINHVDDKAQEIFEDFANKDETLNNAAAHFKQEYKSESSTADDFWNDARQKAGGNFKEITVNMPISTGRTTSTIGIDPDKYGVPDSNYEPSTDYNHLSDGPAVAKNLSQMNITRILRIVATGVIGIFLSVLGISAASGASIIPALNIQYDAFYFLVINLALLVASAFICITTITQGIVGIFGRPTADTLTTLAVIGAFIQNLYYTIDPSAFVANTVTLFAPLAVLLLFGNAIGKWIHCKSVIDNFKLTSAGEDHSAAVLVQNRELTKMVCTGLGEPDPLLLVSRPTELVRGFMRQSFSSHISDVYGRKLSLIMLMCCVVCGVVVGLRASDLGLGLSAGAAALCLGAPIAATLVYAVPSLLLQRSASAAGAVVPGPSAVQSLGLCNTVLLHSNDLFPASSVRLHGIKPFDGKRIDHAILYAASLVFENCATLQDTFMMLIDNKESMLYKVVDAETDTGYGFSGMINGEKVIFGNRAMMRRNYIDIPSIDYERKFTKNGQRCVMYLSVDSKPYSMYVISYSPDANAQSALDNLAESGVSAVVQSDDFNLTAQLVATTYNISPALIKVLSQPEREMLAPQTEYMPESEGYMTHKGTCDSFVGGLRAAATAARREQLANTVTMAAVLFTMLISIILSVAEALPSLALSVAILYQIAWCVITVIPAIFKK